MKIRKVTAHAFGPFVEQTLELAPGMTIIRGPNEAGKSSWHSAIYAALCGMRRARGRRKSEDQDFADRHEPWDGDTWDVACQLDLPDGRRFELRHDLGGGVDCSARDLDLGTDVSQEIIFEGSPDGARWLGIDRRIFLAVACVRQAEILAVTQHATALQDTLQRAAATAGTQETAATALATISEFRREAVGLRRANSSRPLQAAIDRRRRAEQERERAASEHDDWLTEREQASSLEIDARTSEARLHSAEWELCRQRIESLRLRYRDAAQLAERYPLPPPDQTDDDATADLVAAAVRGWEERPTPTAPPQPTAEDLQRELDALPEMPDGDLEPHESADTAAKELDELVRRRDDLERHRPQRAPHSDTQGWSAPQLADLLRELDVSVPPVDAALVAEVERLRVPAAEPARTQARPLVIAGGIIAAAGVATLALGITGMGVALLLIGVATAAGGGWMTTRAPRSSPDDSALRAAETRLLVAEQMHASAQSQLDAARQRARGAGLPTDVSAVRELASRAYEAERALASFESWETELARLSVDVETACNALRRALSDRSVTIDPGVQDSDLLASHADYRRACRDRRDVASGASRRPDLEQTVLARLAEERRYAADLERAHTAEQRLRDAASATHLADETSTDWRSEVLVDQLRRWLDDRAQRRSSIQQALREWDRLRTLLDGLTLDELRDELDRSSERFEAMALPDPAEQAHLENLSNELEQLIPELRSASQTARERATMAASEVRVKAERLRSVPEADEELAAAQLELRHLETLESTLDRTAEFLRAAQERVHRDIAPVLQAKVRDRLERVTGGRYSDVIVDPDDLEVQVRQADGHWRPANRLSHGTAEQVYLLLRIAIAEILTNDGTNCPLLLDDATVQSDPVRTRAILDVLHEASADHQIILFSQEAVVSDWAEEELTDRDKLITLEPVPSSGDSHGPDERELQHGAGVGGRP
jgi:DNA repair protein SbcC/Rad50